MSEPDLSIMRELISFTMDRALQHQTFTGAFIVKDGEVVSREITSVTTDQNCLAHAELKAIASASRTLGMQLDGCTLYTTQKPCAMCASAIVWSGLKSVFYGVATNHHWEKESSIKEFFDRYNIECVGPVLEEECKKIDQYLIANGI